MTDIVIRTSDGLVHMVADTITSDSNAYYVHGAIFPFTSYTDPSTLVHNVSGVPSDLVGGWNYKYANGSFTSTGMSPPAKSAPNPWASLQPIAAVDFINLLVGIVGPAGFARLETDPASQFVWAEILKATTIDPNDQKFQSAIAYMVATKGQDGNLLMTSAQVAALNSNWS